MEIETLSIVVDVFSPFEPSDVFALVNLQPSWDVCYNLSVTKGVPVVREWVCGHMTTLQLLTLNMWQSYDPLYSSVWLRHCSYSSHTHTYHTYPHIPTHTASIISATSTKGGQWVGHSHGNQHTSFKGSGRGTNTCWSTTRHWLNLTTAAGWLP